MLLIAQACWDLQLMVHTQLYRNSKEWLYAGFPETKFGTKYLKAYAAKFAPLQVQTTIWRSEQK